MYIFTYIANCPDIPEYHDKVQTFMIHNISVAIDAYKVRRNNPIYAGMTVEYYYNGSYTDMAQTFNDIIDKRG